MLKEPNDVAVPAAEEPFDVARRAVAKPDPDDLRRCPSQHAEALKILVLLHEEYPLAAP